MDTLIINQIKSIIDKEVPLISNLSNVSAILNTFKDINWAGFYIDNGKYLYLGPFQGEVACTKIDYGKGVVGDCFNLKQSIIVDDVDQYKGHIRCSSLSKSEIVVPIIKNSEVKAIIDIDSPIIARFNKSDELLLIEVANILKDLF